MKTKFGTLLTIFLTCLSVLTIAQVSEFDELVKKAKESKATNDTEGIIEYCNIAMLMNPKGSEPYQLRGEAYMIQKKYYSAIRDFSKVIELTPTESAAYLGRADAYEKHGDIENALKDYTKLVGDFKPGASVYQQRGTIFLSKGKLGYAINDFTKVIELNPRSSAAYNSRGEAYKDSGIYTPALADFRKAIELDPKNGTAAVNTIRALISLRQFPDAGIYYTSYKRNNLSSFLEGEGWKFFATYLTAVNDHVLKDDFAGALAVLLSVESIYKEYYTKNPGEETVAKKKYAEAIGLKGYVLEKLNRSDEAIASYKDALVVNPNQPELTEAIRRLTVLTVVADNIAPVIDLISPTPSRSIDIVTDNEQTQVIGRATDKGGISAVRINGVAVANIEDDGLFVSYLTLRNGSNTINIEAIDKSGNSTLKSFTVITQAVNAVNNASPVAASAEMGITQNFYAIIIAEQDYADNSIPDLTKPLKDARELSSILTTHYTFSPSNIDTLYNRSREDILGAINTRCETLKENDNLLIFYAGHGIAYKGKTGDVDGYLIPVSAQKSNKATFISATDINLALKNSDAKHILVVADACFSGAFLRSLPSDANKGVQKLYKDASRTAMTSGNLEPVPDISTFIYYLKKRLVENTEKYITAKDLFDSFYKAILSNSDNTPRYGAIFNVGDEGGDFVFVKK